VRKAVQDVGEEALWGAFTAVGPLPDSAELVVSLGRVIASHPELRAPYGDTTFGRFQLGRALMSRGHMREAAAYIGMQERWFAVTELALFGGLPRELVAAALGRRLDGPVTHRLVAAFPWWAFHHDTTALRRAQDRADSFAVSDPDPAGRSVARYAAASAAAYASLAKGDTTSAVERFLTLPDGMCPACYLDRFTLAHLLAERRRDREAWAILRGDHPASTLDPFPSQVLWALLLGQVGERVGERDRARQAYTWVVGMWRNADPELQPYVREAREARARMSAEER
jgi:hypothetical protein